MLFKRLDRFQYLVIFLFSFVEFIGLTSHTKHNKFGVPLEAKMILLQLLPDCRIFLTVAVVYLQERTEVAKLAVLLDCADWVFS